MSPYDSHVGDDEPLAAGGFGEWLAGMQRALRREADADVPCRGCTACCTSSQFVHIEPDETGTLALIPSSLLFPAPRAPRGHVLMGYDEQGHCPMLIEGACSIYEHRPRTCRTYDCRVFPAADIELDDAEQRAIASRARRWHFDHDTDVDTVLHEAVRAAARFVDERADVLPEGSTPVNATQRAVLAVQIHAEFIGEGEPDPQAVRTAVERLRVDPAPGS